MNDTDEEYDPEENIEESNISIYDKPFSIDDEFIFYFKEEGEVIGKIKIDKSWFFYFNLFKFFKLFFY